jgi:hypothetical protein
MKKTILLSIFLCVFAGTAWSLTVTVDDVTTDVGDVDTLLTWAALDKSGDGTELAWVQNYFNDYTITLDYKTDAMNWLPTNEAGLYAIGFTTYEPEYFLVKTGNGIETLDDATHFLFSNDTNLGWGVINLYLQLGFEDVVGISGVSHIDEFNGAPVPEPATLILLGSGLIGLAGIRRKIEK